MAVRLKLASPMHLIGYSNASHCLVRCLMRFHWLVQLMNPELCALSLETLHAMGTGLAIIKLLGV